MLQSEIYQLKEKQKDIVLDLGNDHNINNFFLEKGILEEGKPLELTVSLIKELKDLYASVFKEYAKDLNIQDAVLVFEEKILKQKLEEQYRYEIFINKEEEIEFLKNISEKIVNISFVYKLLQYNRKLYYQSYTTKEEFTWV